MEFLHANSKTYLHFSCISISCFSIFSITFFFSTNEDFEHRSMKRDPFNKTIRKWEPKGVFVDLLETYLGMNAGLWSSVYVWFWIFENFCEEFWDV